MKSRRPRAPPNHRERPTPRSRTPPPSRPCSEKRVLLLADGWSPSEVAAQALLAGAGFRVTSVPNHANVVVPDDEIVEYATGYDAVLVLAGRNYPRMPDPLQRALLEAHEMGTGLVFEEWASYNAYSVDRFTLLRPLMLFAYGDFGTGVLTFRATQPDHPVWAGSRGRSPPRRRRRWGGASTTRASSPRLPSGTRAPKSRPCSWPMGQRASPRLRRRRTINKKTV